jgi:asparagine synthase (glutamine-hydrolysing)
LSGIFGIYKRNGAPVDPGALQSAHEVFAQWFDDDRGVWCEHNVGLGHTMLWNTPESALESLPALQGSTGHRLAVTADVRLDNRAELTEKLGITAPIDSITDSCLLLEAYRKWGEDSPKYLLGDFAYAIWDEQHRHLFCARDHIGIKQFFYSLADGIFVFANDVGALIATALVPTDLNKEAIAHYLQSSRYINQRKTFYESIIKLEAASTLLISVNEIARKTYWKAEESPHISFATLDDYALHLRRLLEDAVRARLRTSYPVTSHLSGGLDSSAITVLAARMLSSEGKSPRVFNWSYMPESEEDPECMEWSHAIKVAAQENIPIEHIEITPRFVKKVYLAADFSLYEDNLYWEEASERALSAGKGARTILSGWGGDELISYGGYSYYSGLIRRGKFLRVFKSIYRNGRRNNRSLLQIAKRYVWCALYPFFNNTMPGLYKVEKDKDIFNVVKTEFAPVVRATSPAHLKFQYGPHGEQKELFTHGHILSRIETWGASALRDAVEYSYPLLDKRIVEFALGVPEEVFEPQNGYARYLFRSAVEDILPREVAWAPKYSSPRHFEMRKRLWLAVSNMLLEEESDLFEQKSEFVDTQALYQIIEKIVAQGSTDFDDVENIGVVGPAIAIAVLNRVRLKGE